MLVLDTDTSANFQWFCKIQLKNATATFLRMNKWNITSVSLCYMDKQNSKLALSSVGYSWNAFPLWWLLEECQIQNATGITKSKEEVNNLTSVIIVSLVNSMCLRSRMFLPILPTGDKIYMTPHQQYPILLKWSWWLLTPFLPIKKEKSFSLQPLSHS